MELTSLFRERRSESKIILVLKRITMILIIAYLAAYTIMAIYDVKHDAPIIRTSFKYTDAIRVPDIVFNCPYKFQLICVEVYNEFNSNDTKIMTTDCAPGDLIQPDEKLGPFHYYWGAYQSLKAFPFENDLKISADNLTLLSGIGLFVQIVDSNFTADNELKMPALIDAVALDPDYDTLVNFIKEKRLDELTIIPNSNMYESLVGSNEYVLSLNQRYQFQYSRKIKESIKPSWMNDFGIPPTYETKSYLASTLLSTPLNSSSSKIDNSAMFFIQIPSNNATQVDREIRSNTYLGTLGLVGGAWTLATALYAFLFGADIFSPWGFVQSYCCCISNMARNKLKDNFEIIPFFDTSNTDPQHHQSMHGLSLAEQNKLLLARIDNLEFFLQEYVVDVSYWDKIRRKKIRTSNAANSTRNSTVDTTGINSIHSTGSNTDLKLTHNSTTSDTVLNLTQNSTSSSTEELKLIQNQTSSN